MWILVIKNGPLFEREGSRCSCAIGSTESCGHIVGLLFSLAHMKVSNLKAIPSSVAKTSLPQTWHRTVLKPASWPFFFTLDDTKVYISKILLLTWNHMYMHICTTTINFYYNSFSINWILNFRSENQFRKQRYCAGVGFKWSK